MLPRLPERQPIAAERLFQRRASHRPRCGVTNRPRLRAPKVTPFGLARLKLALLWPCRLCSRTPRWSRSATYQRCQSRFSKCRRATPARAPFGSNKALRAGKARKSARAAPPSGGLQRGALGSKARAQSARSRCPKGSGLASEGYSARAKRAIVVLGSPCAGFVVGEGRGRQAGWGTEGTPWVKLEVCVMPSVTWFWPPYTGTRYSALGCGRRP